MLSNLSLPVIQPFARSAPVSKKLSKEFKPGSEAAVSPNLVSHQGEFVGFSEGNPMGGSGGFGLIEADGGILKVSDIIESSGTLGFSEGANSSGEEVDNLSNGVLPNFPQHKTLNKLLLVGYDKSGTSTIFKQARLVYNLPFSDDERQNIKFRIQSSLYGYLGILLEGREWFEEEWLTGKMKKRIDEHGPSRSCGQLNW